MEKQRRKSVQIGSNDTRIEDPHAEEGEPKWWEFSMSGRDSGFKKPSPRPVQMSLFEAINELKDDDIDVKILSPPKW